MNSVIKNIDTNLTIDNLSHLLLKCSKEKDRANAIRMQTYLHKIGLETHVFLGNCLVSTLVDVGIIGCARQIFDRLQYKKNSSWNSMITGYMKCGMPQHALDMYEKMQEDDIHPNGHAFVALLKACISTKDIEKVQGLHAHIDRCRCLEADDFVGSALVDVYIKLGLLSHAKQVFLTLPICDVVSWTALIAGYAEHGYGEEALKLFDQMQLKGVSPNAVTYICSLKACASVGAIEKGQEMHAAIASNESFTEDVIVGSMLVHMYMKFCLLAKAQTLFDRIPYRNVVSWNTLIAGYAELGYMHEACSSLAQMQLEGLTPNPATYTCVLKACSDVETISNGQEIHAELERKCLLESNSFIGICLVEMYVNCGMLSKARETVQRIRGQNVMLWTALIAGCVEKQHGAEALKCLEEMQSEGIYPDAITLMHSLKACFLAGETIKGEEIHADIERRGLLQSDQLIGNALLDLYAKQGLFIQAWKVFHKLPTQDVVPWTTLISGYIDHDRHEEALDCFKKMKQKNVQPNAFSFVCCLKACGSLLAVEKGREIHAEIDRMGLFKSDSFVGNALMDMYAKFGFLSQAHEVFRILPVRDVVSWTALISGYVEHGFGEEALKCFEKMRLEGVSPNIVALICGLKACSSIGAIEKGREIHADVEKKGLEKDIVVGNTLVDMYAKCGSLMQAQEVFDKLLVKDIVTWTTLIEGYAQVGKGDNVFYIFDSMVREGINPNLITFVSVLNACRHTLSFSKGKAYFEVMSEVFGIRPAPQHYSCIVDLCGRIGQLDNAVAIVKKLPFFPNIAIWQTLMHACKKWGNMELGRLSFEHALC